MEAIKNNPPKEETKTTKPLSGIKEPSSWEKAAETIAGDNQLMSTLLKIVLSPITLLAGAGLIIYLFIQNKSQKDEIVGLKEENKKLTDEKLFLEEASENFRKKYKKIKKVFEAEQQAGQLLLPQGTNDSQQIPSMGKNTTSYLR